MASSDPVYAFPSSSKKQIFSTMAITKLQLPVNSNIIMEQEPSRFQDVAEVEVLSSGALATAYVICHNVQDLLFLRGFTAKPIPVGKKKKGRKKTRKQNSK
ncbi:hypothetical protein QYM36_005678 [Artemia franciscana]|uniref:Uncharacterized protein n=1 Tax=Artemia franciscana TaxID=6661 RepID=A0AA88I533_ARTSF|nr:hypothetical protein QYM36_005678 [Artemia franciscana]